MSNEKYKKRPGLRTIGFTLALGASVLSGCSNNGEVNETPPKEVAAAVQQYDSGSVESQSDLVSEAQKLQDRASKTLEVQSDILELSGGQIIGKETMLEAIKEAPSNPDESARLLSEQLGVDQESLDVTRTIYGEACTDRVVSIFDRFGATCPIELVKYFDNTGVTKKLAVSIDPSKINNTPNPYASTGLSIPSKLDLVGAGAEVVLVNYATGLLTEVISPLSNKSYIYESPTVNTLNQAITDLEAKNGDYSNLEIVGNKDDQAAYVKYYLDVALGVREALVKYPPTD